MKIETGAPGLTVPVSDRDHTQGPADAPLTLVEYGDYECPHCGRLHPIINQLRQQFGDQLRFVYRNFPLATMHRHAQHAAEAAESAGVQGKFWPMHDLLFEHQNAETDEDLVHYATQAGLDMDQFMSDMKQHVHAARVREDFLTGVRSGVNATPTLFLNARRLDGHHDLETLTAQLQSALAAGT